jgi:moderate conductance mechanosensitive channel
VETISFRTIILRDEAGVVHVFPNGSINALANMTKDWSAYVINVNVVYKENTDRVADVVRHVAEEMYADSKYRSAMLETIEIYRRRRIYRISGHDQSSAETRPQQQFAIGREYGDD